MLDFLIFVVGYAAIIAAAWLCTVVVFFVALPLVAIKVHDRAYPHVKCAIAHPDRCRVREDVKRRWHLALIVLTLVGIFGDSHLVEAFGFLTLAISVEWV